MSLSGTFSFTVTRDDIIRESMLNNGLLYETEAPTAQEVTDLSRKLNMIVKQWQGKADFAPGLKVWTRTRAELFLSATTGEYYAGTGATGWGSQVTYQTTTATALTGASTITLASASGISSGYNIGVCLDSGALFWTTVNGAPSGNVVTLTATLPSQATFGANVFAYATTSSPIRPERIETAVLRDINNNDIPLDIMNLQDYEILPTKTSANYIADPQALYYEYQTTSSALAASTLGKIYLDVGACADTTKHIHLVYLSPVMDFNNPTDNPQYPQGWYQALAWELSKQSCSMFNKIWSKHQEECRKEAIAIAREQFPETESMFFEPGREGTARRV